MNELILKRAIMLDSGEIIPAGSVLKNYGEFIPKSISPSLIACGTIQFRGKNRLAFKQAGEKNTIFFFRIPRECIDETTLSNDLKNCGLKARMRFLHFFVLSKNPAISQIEKSQKLKIVILGQNHCFLIRISGK